MKQKVFDKTTTEGAALIKYPLDLLQYQHHPKFMKGAETLYMMIAHYYNADKGFAYPSMTLLAADCATTESTIMKNISLLASLGLINVVHRPKGNLYVPMQPLNREGFFNQFPEAIESYVKRYRKVEERREIRERYLAEIKKLHSGENADYADEDHIDLDF
jgi:replication initiation and membrane attachment protein DnaB